MTAIFLLSIMWYILYREVVVKEEQKESYKPVYITIQLSSEINKLLSESAARSHRKKLQEATIRLDDHLMRFHSISEKGKTNLNIGKQLGSSLFKEKI